VIVVSNRSAEGTELAAAPCRHRAAVSIATVVADAPTAAPTANVNRPARITRRWPNRSPSRAQHQGSPLKNIT